MRELSSRRLRKVPDATEALTPAITSLRLHLICVVQALLAACVFTVTEHDHHHLTLWCTLEIALQSVLVVAATAFVRWRVSRVARSAVIMPILIMVVCLSLICEPIQRLLLGHGHSFEILIMHSQCNLLLALAVCGFRMSFQRLSVLIAIFMTIFCCTISDARELVPLVTIYSVSAVVWLVASWWENIDRRVLHETRRRLPALQLAATAGIPMVLLLGATGAGANRTTTALNGWLPGSGGTGEYDPFSRGGVNDGDALVAGSQNIKSFAAIKDAPFLDSDKPSLYDVLNDTFDEPAKPIKEQQRAIALSAEFMQHVHRQISEAKQAGREFSLVRDQRQATDSQARDLNAHALFHVAGRTPVHLRMEVLDLFDGVSWLAGETKPASESPRIKTVEDRPWLSIPVSRIGYDFFSGTETHSLKTSGLDGNVIPAPAHLAGINIPHVDRADMFKVDATGIVSLTRDSVPSMTQLNVVSHCVDRRAVDRAPLGTRTPVPDFSDNPLVALPFGEDMNRVRELAVQLTAGRHHDWSRIVAIEEYLRNNCTLDRATKVSPDTVSPVEEFLFGTRRGPEYLFAGSAAVMLRSIGFPARVVSGFYARPDKYDAHRHHTPVHASDAHVWCEVCVGPSTWLTIEPSPGYELLAPPPDFWERVVSGLRVIWRAVVDHVITVLMLGLLLLASVLQRRVLENALRTVHWHLTARHSHRSRVTRLARLIDHRLRLTGLPRQHGTTLKRWADRPRLTPVRNELTRIADLADQATFDTSSEELSVEPGELNRLASRLSFHELRRINRASSNMVG